MLKGRYILAVFVIVAAVSAVQLIRPQESVADQARKFSSREQLTEYIAKNRELAGYWYGSYDRRGVMAGAAPDGVLPKMAAPAGSVAVSRPVAEDSFSATNVQVSGVDESDIIKNDGRYLYVVSGNKVDILDAFPAESAKLLSSINCDGYPMGIYIKGDSLVVIANRSGSPGILLTVYDLSDRAKPRAVRTMAWEGSYVSSRMIGDYAYIVLSLPVLFEGRENGGEGSVILPGYTENGKAREIQPGEISYFDYPDYSYNYTMIASVNIAGSGEDCRCGTYLTGASQNIYSSVENLYLTGPNTPDPAELCRKYINGLATLVTGETAEKIRSLGDSGRTPDQKLFEAERLMEEYIAGLNYVEAAVLEERIGQMRDKYNRDIARERNKTAIFKFAVRDGGVEYVCRGVVDGQPLNQFSMDEYGGYFRVATTSEGYLLTGSPVSRNNIYVLDGDLKVVGKLENLAPTERIYSARFMGGRAYLVTFKRVDPLFVINLENPTAPEVMGQLKIPGYSDYLHPYDENHIIGIGKEVDDPGPRMMQPITDGAVADMIMPRPAIPQGVKVALFDVSDPSRPVEISKYFVGQGSDSEALRDHKAFLFSRERNLMAFPVSLPETGPDLKKGGQMPYLYRQWQGMLVFDISEGGGIKLRGRIEHPNSGGWYAGSTEAVRRAAYIENVLYTISDGGVKLSRMDNLSEIKMIKLPAGDTVQ
ncbi:MAG: beta-propeller domain-containing protein [Bacillota bacterium]